MKPISFAALVLSAALAVFSDSVPLSETYHFEYKPILTPEPGDDFTADNRAGWNVLEEAPSQGTVSLRTA
jgi:hypothetical protein